MEQAAEAGGEPADGVVLEAEDAHHGLPGEVLLELCGHTAEIALASEGRPGCAGAHDATDDHEPGKAGNGNEPEPPIEPEDGADRGDERKHEPQPLPKQGREREFDQREVARHPGGDVAGLEAAELRDVGALEVREHAKPERS